MKFKKKIIPLIIVPILAVLSFYYKDQVNIFFGTTYASNYLLIGLIAVEALNGFFAYFLESINREHKQRSQQITDHADKIIEAYDHVWKNKGTVWSGRYWAVFFQMFAYKKEFLEHLYTGHPDIYSSLTTFMVKEPNLEKPDAHSSQFKETVDAQVQFEDNLKQLTNGIDLKTTSLGGVCNQCIKWYEKDKNFKALKSKLDSFIMPF